MNAAQVSDAQGFVNQTMQHGRQVSTDQKDYLTVLVEDIPVIPEPSATPRAKLPVWVRITSLSQFAQQGTGFSGYSVLNPRLVKTFMEPNRSFAVQRYEEKAGDVVRWSWVCEAQRQN